MHWGWPFWAPLCSSTGSKALEASLADHLAITMMNDEDNDDDDDDDNMDQHEESKAKGQKFLSAIESREAPERKVLPGYHHLSDH